MTLAAAILFIGFFFTSTDATLVAQSAPQSNPSVGTENIQQPHQLKHLQIQQSHLRPRRRRTLELRNPKRVRRRKPSRRRRSFRKLPVIPRQAMLVRPDRTTHRHRNSRALRRLLPLLTRKVMVHRRRRWCAREASPNRASSWREDRPVAKQHRSANLRTKC